MPLPCASLGERCLCHVPETGGRKGCPIHAPVGRKTKGRTLGHPWRDKPTSASAKSKAGEARKK